MSTSTSTSSPSHLSPLKSLPHIHLLMMDQKFQTAFTSAFPKNWPSYPTESDITTPPPPIPITIHSTPLKYLSPNLTFDLIVSPANSYGRLDGAFDDAISRAFCLPDHQYDTLTRAAQGVLYEKYRGFAPPGSCTLVPFPEEMLKTGNDDGNESVVGGRWGCKWVALCPTMRTPDSARWDREVVYECVWSLLCAVEGWNRALEAPSGTAGLAEEKDRALGRIESVLITPMATGCGGVSPEKWAAQFVLAMRHFVDAVERPERWRGLGWGEIYADTEGVVQTWKM